MDPIELAVFASRIEAVCEEMGAALKRTAFSPNIKDRLDFSCAVFDARGDLCAQAAHIPVHLGSMAWAMRDIVGATTWDEGEMVVVNDPYLGGTHLPDITVIAPLHVDGKLVGFVANRAHHANVGAHSPGSMPISRRLEEEGAVIPPTALTRNGGLDRETLRRLLGEAAAQPEVEGDFAAQVSANRTGLERLAELVRGWGAERYPAALNALNDYAERLAESALCAIPDGEYRFTDCLDDDGVGHRDLPITLTLTARAGRIDADFTGTAPQTPGNVNCPISVAAAGVFYVLRCLMPAQTPACAGSMRPLTVTAPEGCLVNARRPAAVAAGNVETSSRVVDVVCGALAGVLPERIPAASHGSMNNVAMGARTGEGVARNWDYYETMGGGMGAGARGGGLDAVQTHMTNTRNTPVEVLEMAYPLRLRRYAVRRASGGAGRRRGGDGLVREFEFLEPAQVTLLTERRRHAPWGLAGGSDGAPGVNRLNGEVLPPKVALHAAAGDRLTIETPGGGGWGKSND